MQSSETHVNLLRFTAYDHDGPAQKWPLVDAHMVGPEDVPLKGQVRFKDGHIQCQVMGNDAVSLALQYQVEGIGQFVLQTCLLPPRLEPYVLSVELARHRIKMFITKCEEWQMLDIDSEHPAMRRWERARTLFTEALASADVMKADRRARQALAHALHATERLSLAHADILLHRRYGQRAATSTTLGVSIWPQRNDRPLRDIVGRDFDVVSIPIRWKDVEVEEGRYRWDAIDGWIQWAQAQGKPIVAGPLLDFSLQALPEWMHMWQHDYDTCRDLAYDHVERVVQRYRPHVGLWNIACGLNVNDNFEFTPDQMLDLARMASLVVRQSRKRARVMIELSHPFGQPCARNRHAMTAVSFVDRLIQEGIRLDAIGIRLQMGLDDHGMGTRDLMQISNILDRLFLLEIPVLVSAAGVPSAKIDDNGGWWHDEWSGEIQARWGSQVMAIALSKPYVETVLWGDLYDHEGASLPMGGLISADGKAKPVLGTLIALRKRLRKPLGQTGTSSATDQVSST
jgi:hypothetical protein